jgi:hypothetical protein
MQSPAAPPKAQAGPEWTAWFCPGPSGRIAREARCSSRWTILVHLPVVGGTGVNSATVAASAARAARRTQSVFVRRIQEDVTEQGSSGMKPKSADLVLPLSHQFPRHTTAKFNGSSNFELMELSHSLVKKYFDKVGLPGKPIVPKGGALSFDLASTLDKPKGEMRLRLLGIAPGDKLYFEVALFRPDRQVAWGSTQTVWTQAIPGADEADPPPSKWIPGSALAAMEKLEGGPASIKKPPPKPRPHVAVVLGVLAEVNPPAALKGHGHRSVYVVSESVYDKLPFPDGFPEKPIAKADDERAVAAVEKYYDSHLEALTKVTGMHFLHDENMIFGLHASASLEELAAFALSKSYRVVGLP